MSQSKPDRGVSNMSAPQAIDTARKFVTRQPAIEGLRDRITKRWLDGALTLSLSKEYTCRRAFIEAVARDGTRRVIEMKQAEIARLRMELQQMRRAA